MKPQIKLNQTVKKIIPGWQGKAKGLLQVLWERGWIDQSQVSQYKMHAVSELDSEIPEYSLVSMMTKCVDFQEETSQIEYMAAKMGAMVITTTKYHSEFAGEGIEYTWGVAKSIYRKLRLECKRTKQDFLDNVKSCLSTANLLTKEKVRRFSKRARAYILGYYALGLKQFPGEIEESSTVDKFNTIPLETIEKLAREFNTHRSALDYETGFIQKSSL